jgi:hypothetical protein
MNQTTEEKLAKLLQEFAELKAKLAGTQAEKAELKGRVERLEPPKPFVSSLTPERFDPMENLRIPADAVNALVSNVGDDLMRSIVGDHSRNLRRR